MIFRPTKKWKTINLQGFRGSNSGKMIIKSKDVKSLQRSGRVVTLGKIKKET